MFPSTTRFLVVDDLKTMRAMLSEALNKLGYFDIIEASDGQKALRILRESLESDRPVEFIVADWNMPEMTGIELLEERNNDPQLEGIPFLMVTIEGEKEYVLKAVSMGVSDFIVKPFSEKTLGLKIKSIYQRQKK